MVRNLKHKVMILLFHDKIVELRLVSEELMAVVRVQDGTVSKGMFLQVMKCGKRKIHILNTTHISNIEEMCVCVYAHERMHVSIGLIMINTLFNVVFSITWRK